MTEKMVPENFKPFNGDNTFNDVIAPLYIDVTQEYVSMGMRVEKQHCNFVGFCHGGAMMTFLDIALAGAVCAALGKYVSTPTVNMTFDFLSGVKEGDWLQTDIQYVKLTRTMAFVSAMIEGPRGSVARASACYKLPADIDAAPGMSADEYHAWRMQD